MSTATTTTSAAFKRDWNLLTDEEERRDKRAKARTEINTYVREREGGAMGQKIRETVKIERRIFPVKQAVIARKEMKKFGDVKDVPLGMHQKGDYITADEVNIETLQCADKGEIDIVNKLMRINTDTIKMNKDKEKMEQLATANKERGTGSAATGGAAAQQSDFIEVGNKNSRKPKTLESLTFGNENEEYTVEISNILSFLNARTEEQILEEERLFKLLLEEFVGKNTPMNRYQTRFPRNKKTRDLMGKCFITFFDKTTAENLLDDIEGEEYGNAILAADWARARAPARR